MCLFLHVYTHTNKDTREETKYCSEIYTSPPTPLLEHDHHRNELLMEDMIQGIEILNQRKNSFMLIDDFSYREVNLDARGDEESWDSN